jgi:hypothetical protein
VCAKAGGALVEICSCEKETPFSAAVFNHLWPEMPVDIRLLS